MKRDDEIPSVRQRAQRLVLPGETGAVADAHFGPFNLKL